MKIVKLSGGLGNQMFQYAFAQALKHYGHEVLFDVEWFEKVKKSAHGATQRNFDLQVFNVDVPVADAKSAARAKRAYFCGVKLPAFIFDGVQKEKCAYSYYEEFLTDKKKSYYAGVFSNVCYFYKYRDEIVRAFSLKEKLDKPNEQMLQKIKNSNSVSVHIRRGDYVKLGLTCNLAYYQNAVAAMEKQVEAPHFYIFSDDIAWVKENLPLKSACTFVDINSGETGYFDMELMKNCRHNIIANSTFSWWAAWLNENPDKIVLAPYNQTSDKFVRLFR